jgi:hypothetical protein
MEYLVFCFDLAMAPLNEDTPRGSVVKNFDQYTGAQLFASQEKEKWDRIIIYKRESNELLNIEEYGRPLDGVGPIKHYIRGERISENS